MIPLLVIKARPGSNLSSLENKDSTAALGTATEAYDRAETGA